MDTENSLNQFASRKTTLVYSFTPTKDGTLVSAERTTQDDVANIFPEAELFTYGDVEALVDLLIEKDIEAWRALPENLKSFLMCSTEWQYVVNKKTDIINLIINDVEIRWNGVEWVVQAFHPDKVE